MNTASQPTSAPVIGGITAFSVEASAAAAGVSVAMIRRALRSSDPSAFPPPLRAKRAGGTRILIPVSELERWVASLPAWFSC